MYIMFELDIIGEIVQYQDEWVDKNGYVNLKIVKNKIQEANGKPLMVNIHTIGGDVEEGFAIYALLRRYASENKTTVVTRAIGQVASIGTVIFLAGDKRIGSPIIQPFMHEARMSSSSYQTANETIETANMLIEANNMIAEHYEKHLKITKQEALQLMSSDTYLSAEDQLSLGFSTEIENIQKPINKLILKKINMSNKKTLVNKLMAIFKDSGFNIENKIINDAENKEIDFYELEPADVIKVGDKANYDGNPADGEILGADGNTYVFEKGVLMEIKEPSQEEPDESKDTEIQNLKAEIEALKSEKATLETSMQNAINEKTKIENAMRETIKAVNSLKEEEDITGGKKPNPHKPIEKQNFSRKVLDKF